MRTLKIWLFITLLTLILYFLTIKVFSQDYTAKTETMRIKLVAVSTTTETSLVESFEIDLLANGQDYFSTGKIVNGIYIDKDKPKEFVDRQNRYCNLMKNYIALCIKKVYPAYATLDTALKIEASKTVEVIEP